MCALLRRGRPDAAVFDDDEQRFTGEFDRDAGPTVFRRRFDGIAEQARQGGLNLLRIGVDRARIIRRDQFDADTLKRGEFVQIGGDGAGRVAQIERALLRFGRPCVLHQVR